MITIHGTKQKEETLGLIACAWFDAPVGSEIEIIQPNHLGGKSLEKLLVKYFPDARTDSHNKSRFITITKTEGYPDILESWLEYTKIRYVPETGFYSVPGLFGWNKIDKGSQMLIEYLSDLKGAGADFGCGYGYLSKFVLSLGDDTTICSVPNVVSPLRQLYCLDMDDRAIEACKKNIKDDRAIIRQADCSRPIDDLPPLDFIIMNPPFHEGKSEDRDLGQDFIKTASAHLKKGGVLLMVANRHLPYEKTLESHFQSYHKLTENNGFKIFKALK